MLYVILDISCLYCDTRYLLFIEIMLHQLVTPSLDFLLFTVLRLTRHKLYKTIKTNLLATQDIRLVYFRYTDWQLVREKGSIL